MDFHIDAKNKILGRVSSEIALILQGKKSPEYERNRVSGDRVFLKNFKEIKVSGNKSENKIYYRHTGYVGHLKETKYKDAFAKDSKQVIRTAVRKMLPKNFLNPRRLKNLIFVEE